MLLLDPKNLLMLPQHKGRAVGGQSFFPTGSYPFINSIFPSIGNEIPFYQRTTIKSIFDFENISHSIEIGEMGFIGGRRVFNRLKFSETFNSDESDWDNLRCEVFDESVPATGELPSLSLIVQDFPEESTIETGGGPSITFSVDYPAFWSFFVKKSVNYDWCRIRTNSSPNVDSWINLATGTVGTLSPEHVIEIDDKGDGVFRVKVFSDAALSKRFSIFAADTNGSTIVRSGGSFYLGGAQFEKASGSQTTAGEYVSSGVSASSGEELIDEGNFDAVGDWQEGTGWIVADGKATWSTGSGNGSLYQDDKLKLNKWHKLEYTILENTFDGILRLSSATSTGQEELNTTPGKHVLFFNHDGVTPGSFELRAVTGTSGIISLDNISVKTEYFHGANVDSVKYFLTDWNGISIRKEILQGFSNEEKSTNLIPYSIDFANAAWAKVDGADVSPNEAIAPNGSLTADLLDLTANSNSRIIEGVTATKTGKATASLFLKALPGESGLFPFRFRNSTQNTNITKLVPLTDDTWTHVEITNDFVAGDLMIFYAGTRQGTAGDLFRAYGWGAQIEELPYSTSLMLTDGAPVTRTADYLYLDNTSRKVLPNSFCLLGTWTPLAAGDELEDINYRPFSTEDDRGDTNKIKVTGHASSYSYTLNGSGGSFNLALPDINKGVENKLAFKLFQNGADSEAKVFKDGLLKLDTTQAQLLEHSNQKLEIGSFAGSVFSSYIKDILLYSSDLPDTKILELNDPIYSQDENGEFLLDENDIPLILA